MPYRDLDVMVGAAYQTSGGNWQDKVLYLNDYAWKQILYGDGERKVKVIDEVTLDPDSKTIMVKYDGDQMLAYNLKLKSVFNTDFGNGMVYFYINTKLSKWSAN